MFPFLLIISNHYLAVINRFVAQRAFAFPVIALSLVATILIFSIVCFKNGIAIFTTEF